MKWLTCFILPMLTSGLALAGAPGSTGLNAGGQCEASHCGSSSGTGSGRGEPSQTVGEGDNLEVKGQPPAKVTRNGFVIGEAIVMGQPPKVGGVKFTTPSFQEADYAMKAILEGRYTIHSSKDGVTVQIQSR